MWRRPDRAYANDMSMTPPTDRSQHGLALPALQQVRRQRGLSQEELADRVGMTSRSILNLEHGASRARPSNAYRLAEALQVPTAVLTGELSLAEHERTAPIGVLTSYCDAAMRHARYRRSGGEQVRVYGAIPGIEGLWARGFTREETERDLREALEWFVLTSVFDHRPLPAFDGVSLEIVEESASGTLVVYPVAPPSSASFLDHLETPGDSVPSGE